MGGQLALFAATLNPSVGATVNFYGIHPEREARLLEAVGPGAGALRGEGRVRDAAGGQGQLDAAIKKAGKQSEIHIYPNVDHAFFNDENTAAYNKAAADDAWRRTLGHFRQHLK